VKLKLRLRLKFHIEVEVEAETEVAELSILNAELSLTHFGSTQLGVTKWAHSCAQLSIVLFIAPNLFISVLSLACLAHTSCSMCRCIFNNLGSSLFLKEYPNLESRFCSASLLPVTPKFEVNVDGPYVDMLPALR
jgi:hypothetical protein